jgi:predicted phosphate transport protein (TIGR00153 family)
MFFFKKEKEVVELLLKHLDVVEECLTTGIKTIQTYLKGNTREANDLAKQVDKIESKADLIRYEIRDKLYAGAYLPRLREDIYRLVVAVDEVEISGETCSY